MGVSRLTRTHSDVIASARSPVANICLRSVTFMLSGRAGEMNVSKDRYYVMWRGRFRYVSAFFRLGLSIPPTHARISSCSARRPLTLWPFTDVLKDPHSCQSSGADTELVGLFPNALDILRLKPDRQGSALTGAVKPH